MYRLLVGLIIVMTIELWSGAATVHGEKLDIVVGAVITGGTRTESEGKFTVTNHTTDFSVKAFAVTLGNALSAATTRSMWAAQATDENPIPGLPGSGGGLDDPKEYVFYFSTGNYLAPGEVADSFTFSILGLLEPFAVGILAVDRNGGEVTCIGSVDTLARPGSDCQVLPNLTSPLTSLGPAELWIGLKNSDDQGTQFDLRAEVYIIGVDTRTLVSAGETLCITGVTRNPSKAKKVTVEFDEISDGTFYSGDTLFLTILTRVGTNQDGTKCSGPGGSHNNAVGLRLYYDAENRPSRFGVETELESLQDFFLHSYDGDFLDSTAPTATAAQFKDSAGVNFARGNAWKEIGTWSMPLP